MAARDVAPRTQTSHRGVPQQAAAALCLSAILLASAPMNADALLASPKRDLPRTAEAALRRSIPIFNAHTAALQSELETVQYFLRIPQRKPWASMATSAATAGELAADADAWYVLLRTGSVAATRSPHPVVHPTRRLTPARSCASDHLSIELFLLLTLTRVLTRTACAACSPPTSARPTSCSTASSRTSPGCSGRST